jgi:energy-coupling factor transport system substrate-specific component
MENKTGGGMTPRIPVIVLASACIALNVAVGSLVYVLKLPVYLDSVGIMAAAILVPGSRLTACGVSALVAIISFLGIGLLVSPYEPWYMGTGIAGGIYGSLVVRGRVNDLIDGTASVVNFVLKLILFGIGWAVVAAVVSAPVTVYIFKGVTGAGTTLFFAFLVKTGQQVVNAVLLTGLSAEPIDKTLSLLLAIMMGRFTPPEFRRLLQHPVP